MKTATFALIFGIVYLVARPARPGSGFAAPAAGGRAADPIHPAVRLPARPVPGERAAQRGAPGDRRLGIAAWRGLTDPYVYARSVALFFGALAVMGLIPGMNTLFGIMPIYGHDVWLHAVSAAIAAYFGWRATEPEMERRNQHERRQRMLPVARERRLGLADRRHLAYGAA